MRSTTEMEIVHAYALYSIESRADGDSIDNLLTLYCEEPSSFLLLNWRFQNQMD